MTTLEHEQILTQWVINDLEATAPPAPLPPGKVSVLQDKLAALLKLATDTATPNKYAADTQIIVLTADDARLSAEVWGASGFVCVGYIGAKVERKFRCAVALDVLPKLVPLLSPERIDITYDPNTDRRNFNLRCGANVSNIHALHAADCPPPAENEVITLTDAQSAAAKWCKLATGKIHDRDYAHYVHVENGRMVATDGKRIHVATVDTENLGEWIDVYKFGQPQDLQFPDVGAFLNATGESVAVLHGKSTKKHYVGGLLDCIKAVAGKGKQAESVEIEFVTDEQTMELVVTGKAGEMASTEQRLAYTGHGFIFRGKYTAKHLIDALGGMVGNSVTITAIGQDTGGKRFMILTDDQGHTAVIMALSDKDNAPPPDESPAKRATRIAPPCDQAAESAIIEPVAPVQALQDVPAIETAPPQPPAPPALPAGVIGRAQIMHNGQPGRMVTIIQRLKPGLWLAENEQGKRAPLWEHHFRMVEWAAPADSRAVQVQGVTAPAHAYRGKNIPDVLYPTYNADIVPGESIRIYGERIESRKDEKRGEFVFYPVLFDRTFKLGDTADNHERFCIGVITSITAKRVKIENGFHQHNMDLFTFIWSNCEDEQPQN